MSGIRVVRKIRDIELELDRLGLQLAESKYWHSTDDVDIVAVVPKGDGVPVYSRDAEVFVGTLEAVEHWIAGVLWDRRYLTMSGIKEKQIHRKEQDIRNKQLVEILKQSETKAK
jgi:hypothetical protein